MDGRGLTELRQISVDVGVLPRAHGSGLFTRGETQVLTVATLGSSSDVQRIDTISPKTEKRYIHHYNFPPYSTGENKPMRGPSRRDIGHGNLAERALIPVLPSNEDFPYVIRLVSECMSSNGSTSMASTCGSTLALMDAGVPISAPVAGAAMGLISEPDGRFVVLTDILGKEDSVGDMDFKVTGTRDGITALQMDIKVQGINEAIIRDGLKQALAARLEILDKMTEVMPEARDEMSDFAPRIITIKINPEKIREIIGKGGSMIRKIQEETQTEINVEDDGTVEIAAVSGENARKAIQLDREPDPRGRGRLAVPRQGHPDHGLRRVRRDPARARKASSASASWPTTTCRPSRTSCPSATRSWSSSPRSTARAGSTSRARPRCSATWRRIRSRRSLATRSNEPPGDRRLLFDCRATVSRTSSEPRVRRAQARVAGGPLLYSGRARPCDRTSGAAPYR